RVDEAPVEALRLLCRIQHDGVLHHTGRPKGIADTADGDNERVVRKRPRRCDLAPFFIERGGKMHLPLGTIDAGHLAIAELEGMPVPLRKIVDPRRSRIQAASSDLIQSRLPYMRA